MQSKINWFKDTDGTYKKTLRGYSAVITINPDGTATLVVTGAGAPADATYATRHLAKDAFRTFLFTKPVS